MVTTIRNLIADESGATAIEYGLIAALIAVALVTALDQLGNNLSDKFNVIKDNITNAK